MNPDEKIQAEQIKSDRDHHTPTAAAMISHILANLFIHRTKLRQANYYLKGHVRSFSEDKLVGMISDEDRFFDTLSQKVLAEGELIPTTLKEFSDYAMIKESGKLKYESDTVILREFITDLATQNLFVTRGIALAEKEAKFGLADFLKELYGWIKEQELVWQRYLEEDGIFQLEEDE